MAGKPCPDIAAPGQLSNRSQPHEEGEEPGTAGDPAAPAAAASGAKEEEGEVQVSVLDRDR